MKVLYIFILKFFDEIENNGELENFGYRTSYAKEKLKEMVKGYFVEAQWFNDGYVPPFYEFMHNGLYTSGHGAIPAISFIRLENIVGNKEYEWVESNPKIVKSVKLLSRLINDITKRKDEEKKGDGPSGVDCYVNEYGVSREKEIEEIKKMCENAWKNMNEEYMEASGVSRALLKYYLYLGCTLEFIYNKRIDYFTDASSMKQYVTSLVLEQLALD
uniref:Terpene synthase metal-binding domain-containing protein n=2 Tax=Manihot esculenta TaxID=3983 RepID=A0A2C9WC61_MANES